MMLASLACISAILLLFQVSPLIVHATAQFDEPIIILKSSFIDSNGQVNVVGTIRNYAQAPVQVTVGLQTAGGGTLETETYGRTIWPLTDSPFKFVLPDGDKPAGEPFLKDVAQVNTVLHDMLVLTYDGMAVGDERAFVGTVKNTGLFDVHNVSVFAAVHSSDHTRQLDSVRSNVIPIVRPGEEAKFIAVADPLVQPDILYYSCAGLDYDDPITTVKVGNGKILAYDLAAVAQVRNFRYDNSTDSLAFGIRPYSSTGSELTLKIPQLSSNQTVSVMIDGNSHEASVKADGKTMYIDFYVPQGDHDVQVQGVRNVPEIPFAVIALAGIMAAALVTGRFVKAAFKIS
jgi:hypothetical protein